MQGSTFEIRLQNPSGALVAGRDVHCVVVEEGVWSLPDGSKVEAFQYVSTRSDRTNSWIGERQTFSNVYSVPVILGQVMTMNDAAFKSFWSRGATRYAHAEYGGDFFTGKHLGSGTVHPDSADETVGVIVIESGHAKTTGVDFEAGRGPTAVGSYTTSSYSYNFAEPFETVPAVTVLSTPEMKGADGCWPVLTSDPTPSSFGVAVDEDQLMDKERWHLGEHLDYIAFSTEGPIRLFSHT